MILGIRARRNVFVGGFSIRSCHACYSCVERIFHFAQDLHAVFGRYTVQKETKTELTFV